MLVAAVVGLTAASPGGADLFDELYAKGEKQNAHLRTFTASFKEITTSSLLTRQLVAHGRVAVERPSRIALTYTEPDERVVIIDGAKMTMAWPSRGVLQTRDIGASQRRVQKYFVDGSPDELRSHFQITARESAGSGYVVTMIPTRKQIKEGLSRLELEVDGRTLLLSAMTMTFPNGETKQMTFSDVRPNAPIDPAVFVPPQGRSGR